MDPKTTQLLRGTLDVLVLRTLAGSELHGHADNGKRAKFYRMTASGRRQLQLETASWVRYAEAVFKVLQPV